MCHNYIFRVPDWVNTIYLWHLQTNNGTLESPLFLRCGCWVAQDHAHDHIFVLPSTLNLIFRRFCHMQQTASNPCPSQLCAPVILVGPDRPGLRPRFRLALGFLAVICMHFAIQHFKLSPMTAHSCCVCVRLYRYGRSRVALSRPDSWASPLCRPWVPFKWQLCLRCRKPFYKIGRHSCKWPKRVYTHQHTHIDIIAQLKEQQVEFWKTLLLIGNTLETEANSTWIWRIYREIYTYESEREMEGER